ncbi:MAG: peptidylprolyl isomerase, partial [Bacteroidales bacterium]|nr:peptidylprolyl isomerase [Bacteroidales bacterium]
MIHTFKAAAVAALMALCLSASAQRYDGIVNKTVALVGNEVVTIADIENEVRVAGAQGMASDRTLRCNILENLMTNYLFLSQARIDSLEVNATNVEMNLSNRIDQVRTSLGGDAEVEKYFGKPLYKLRQEWFQQFQDQTLIQQEQAQIAGKVPEMTPLDVRNYIDTVDHEDLPIVPVKYQLSQICIYPDREAANAAVKERLLSLRERIINGENFATLARLYSEDPGSARRGGELGMASKSIFWPAFSDAAMSLKPGLISQIVETPDGFHLIEVLDKNGDMFNARHILMKPQYTDEDQTKAFATLDSIRTEVLNDAITFALAARFYSEDAPTRTNGGQMA